CYILQEQSLVGSEVVSCSILPNKATVIACGADSYNVLCSNEFRIGGMMCKQIVQDLAPLIDFSVENFGCEKFDILKDNLLKSGAVISQV
ncbi:MAG: hypothetical protein ACPGVW_14175, partial [Pseudoalteromonas marina]